MRDYLDRGESFGRVRLVRVLEGASEAIVEFTPRPDFGRAPIGLRVDPDGIVVLGAADPVALYAPGLEWEVEDDGVQAMARARITSATPYVLELRCGSDSLAPHPTPEPERRERTEQTWRRLARGSAPAGARAPPRHAQRADPARALPRAERGDPGRRDHEPARRRSAACATGTTATAGCATQPSRRWRSSSWDRRARPTRCSATSSDSQQAEHGAERLRPLYSVLGGDAGTEGVIDAVPGYAGSRPVRVGNAAAQQVQLDVFGPIVELAYAVAVADGNLSESNHLLVEQIVDAVARRWDEPDHGIWEVRRPPRHHVHSRVMCWLAVDRAQRLARLTGRPGPASWSALADRIAADVLEHGWKPEVRSFTAAYDGVDLDAAALQIGLCGLLPADDERFAATVEAVELRLREGPTVYRYRSDDGLPGSEGGFHLCALWLVHAYALVGRQSDAQALFEQVLELAGPTGLLSEQYDPRAERALGNHPQAYSHLGPDPSGTRPRPADLMTIDYEDAVDVGGLSVRLLRPSVPEELFAVAADARGDAPYWAELWPCARALAAHVATLDLAGMRVLELGCGLALPALVAALRGADVLASDVSADALERAAESGRRTLGRPLQTLRADVHEPSALLECGQFDLILGADLLYDRKLAEAIGAVIPRIAPAALVAYAWQGSAIPLAEHLARRGIASHSGDPEGPGRGCSRPFAGRGPNAPRLLKPALCGQSAQALEDRVRDAPDDQRLGAGQLQCVRRHIVVGQLGHARRDRDERRQRDPVDSVELGRELQRRPLVERRHEDRDAHAADAPTAPDVRPEGTQEAPVVEQLDAELLARLAQRGRQQRLVAGLPAPARQRGVT